MVVTVAERLFRQPISRSGEFNSPGIFCLGVCPLTLMSKGDATRGTVASVHATRGMVASVFATRGTVASMFATRGT